MNLFFVHADGRLVTPELTGTILEGVTRSSILRWPRNRATTSTSAGSRSTSGATASPPARSPRCSPAARPPSSPRSAGWSGRTARCGDAGAAGEVTARSAALLDIQYGRRRTRTAGCAGCLNAVTRGRRGSVAH